MDLLEVLGRRFLELDVRVAVPGTNQTSMVRTIRVGGKEAAAMGGDHFQPGKAIERALEDKMRERNRRLHGITDRIGQPAVAGQLLIEFGYALRMNKQGTPSSSALAHTGWNLGSENASPLT